MYVSFFVYDHSSFTIRSPCYLILSPPYTLCILRCVRALGAPPTQTPSLALAGSWCDYREGTGTTCVSPAADRSDHCSIWYLVVCLCSFYIYLNAQSVPAMVGSCNGWLHSVQVYTTYTRACFRPTSYILHRSRSEHIIHPTRKFKIHTRRGERFDSLRTRTLALCCGKKKNKSLGAEADAQKSRPRRVYSDMIALAQALLLRP